MMNMSKDLLAVLPITNYDKDLPQRWTHKPEYDEAAGVLQTVRVHDGDLFMNDLFEKTKPLIRNNIYTNLSNLRNNFLKINGAEYAPYNTIAISKVDIGNGISILVCLVFRHEHYRSPKRICWTMVPKYCSSIMFMLNLTELQEKNPVTDKDAIRRVHLLRGVAMKKLMYNWDKYYRADTVINGFLHNRLEALTFKHNTIAEITTGKIETSDNAASIFMRKTIETFDAAVDHLKAFAKENYKEYTDLFAKDTELNNLIVKARDMSINYTSNDKEYIGIISLLEDCVNHTVRLDKKIPTEPDNVRCMAHKSCQVKLSNTIKDATSNIQTAKFTGDIKEIANQYDKAIVDIGNAIEEYKSGEGMAALMLRGLSS